jgi:hypothetical protein
MVRLRSKNRVTPSTASTASVNGFRAPPPEWLLLGAPELEDEELLDDELLLDEEEEEELLEELEDDELDEELLPWSVVTLIAAERVLTLPAAS